MISFAKTQIGRYIGLSIVAALPIALATSGCTRTSPATPTAPATATEPAQTAFDSPELAVTAMVQALRAHDLPQLQAIFGPSSADILSSGDPVADRKAFDGVVSRYDEKHHFVNNSDGSITLDIGNEDWPMPIPLVKDPDTKGWIFDTGAGKDEIINRRIGQNELNVIQVCKAIVDAEKEYAERDPDHDGIPNYAQKFISDPGKKNGLYWDATKGEDPSPLGDLVAEANADGYINTSNPTGEPRPYHGYLYRIITAQGADAPGGALNYIINGQLIGGFAVVAWPADYGNSGVMTFITNYTGVVYQKDLGLDTDKLARAMTVYNPDSTWKKQE